MHPRTDWCDLLDVIVDAPAPSQPLPGRPADRDRARGRAAAGARRRLPARACLLEPDRERPAVFAPGSAGSDQRRRRAGKVAVRVIDRGPGPGRSGTRSSSPSSAASDAGEGAGLGLAISKGFVEANGGGLGCRPDSPTAPPFAVSFPLVEQPATVGMNAGAAGARRRRRAPDRPGLKVILGNAGYRVEEATTKQEALDAVSVRPPDAIVLDLVLPDGERRRGRHRDQRWSQVRSSCSRRRRRAPEGPGARRRRRRLRHQAVRHRRSSSPACGRSWRRARMAASPGRGSATWRSIWPTAP